MMAATRYKSHVSNAKIPLSKLNRLPSMTPIREEATPLPRQTPSRKPTREDMPEVKPYQPPSELDSLISHYLSQPVLDDSHLPSVCPCCKEVNKQNREKKREARATGTLRPLTFPKDADQSQTPSSDQQGNQEENLNTSGIPEDPNMPSTSKGKSVGNGTGMTSPPPMFRSDTTDLLGHQSDNENKTNLGMTSPPPIFRSDTTDLLGHQSDNENTTNLHDYTVDPLSGTLRSKSHGHPVYKVRPRSTRDPFRSMKDPFRSTRDPFDDSSKSKLQKDIMKASSRYYNSLDKLHGTIQKI